MGSETTDQLTDRPTDRVTDRQSHREIFLPIIKPLEVEEAAKVRRKNNKNGLGKIFKIRCGALP